MYGPVRPSQSAWERPLLREVFARKDRDSLEKVVTLLVQSISAPASGSAGKQQSQHYEPNDPATHPFLLSSFCKAP